MMDAETVVNSLLWAICDGTVGDPHEWWFRDRAVGDDYERMIGIVQKCMEEYGEALLEDEHGIPHEVS